MKASHVFRYAMLPVLLMGILPKSHVLGQEIPQVYYSLQNAYENEEYQKVLDLEAEALAAVASRADTITASTYYTLGDVQYFEGDPELALDYMLKAYELYTKFEAYGADFGNLLYNLTYIQWDFGRYSEAAQYGNMLLEWDRNDYGVNSEEYVSSLTTLSSILQGLNDNKQAEKLCLKALNEIEKESYPYFIVQTHLGDFYKNRGKFTEAEAQLLPALVLIQYLIGSNSVEYASTLAGLAGLYKSWGRYPESERFFLDARDILRDQTPSDGRDRALGAIKNNLAIMYWQMARLDESMALYEELLAEDFEQYGDQHPNYGYTLFNQSTVLRLQGKLQEAEETQTAALVILAESLGTESLVYTQGLIQRLRLQQEQGKYTEAESTVAEIIGNLEEQLGKENIYYMETLLEEGKLYARQNMSKRARKALMRARKMGRSTYSEQHPKYAQATRQLAILHWYDQEVEPAIEAYEATFNNYLGQIDAYFPALSEPEKAKFYNNTLKVTFEEFNSFAIAQSAQRPELLGKMYDYQLATKALIMYSTSKVREAIAESGNQELIDQFTDWLSLKERISKMYSMSQEELAEEPESLSSLLEQANRLEKALGESSREFASTFSQEITTWQQIRDELAEGEAAVEIIRFRNFLPESAGTFDGQIHYAALVVRHDTQTHPELVLIENGAELEADWVAYYRNSVIYRLIDEQSYTNFWNPIKAKLEGINKVYVSPDGLYHQISFNTLLNPETGDFLLDEIELEQVTNTKDILAYTNATNSSFRSGKAFLFGFPNYNLGLDAETLAAAEVANKVANTVSLDRGLRGSLQRYVDQNQLLAMLPGTKTEVEVISNLYGQKNQEYTIYLEDQAVEEQLKQMEAPSTLHIATHGFFLEDTPEAEGGNDQGYVANPLLRSGLILAGANTFIAAGANESPLTQEDGILTAFEVMNLNLSATDLVVLSACETGLGTIKNGEGVYGLQRAFRVAGADAIIMSLWSVNDQATQELMSQFYANWLDSGDKQEAFRMAQKQLREKFPNPYFWGAFVMVGR
ncbi:MAG: CHAT domain-containing tetratricopeptide repeat protein [Bacteroidota bacterium]